MAKHLRNAQGHSVSNWTGAALVGVGCESLWDTLKVGCCSSDAEGQQACLCRLFLCCSFDSMHSTGSNGWTAMYLTAKVVSPAECAVHRPVVDFAQHLHRATRHRRHLRSGMFNYI